MAAEFFNVISSMLGGAEYDPEQGVLTVTLRGRPYTTYGVSKDDWEAFKTSPSPGRWYQQNIMRKL